MYEPYLDLGVLGIGLAALCLGILQGAASRVNLASADTFRVAFYGATAFTACLSFATTKITDSYVVLVTLLLVVGFLRKPKDGEGVNITYLRS